MRSTTHFIQAIILFIFFEGCDTNKPIDREAVREELARREIRKISNFQIFEKGKEYGNIISDRTQKNIKKNLLDAINSGGLESAIEYCDIKAEDLINFAGEESQITIFRTSQKIRNRKNRPDSIESLILEAYQYSIDNNLEIEHSIIEENQNFLLYTKPIIISDPLCLNCHGSIGNQITEKNYLKILARYPEDSATGYKLGDFRGMWAIRIPKKEIVSMFK